MTRNKCPYCRDVLLRHARHRGVYWFCTSCWQEIPDKMTNISSTHQANLGIRSGKDSFVLSSTRDQLESYIYPKLPEVV
ncbi:MAG TPA: hypothetical protein V6C58_26985 [Allocoleopsis sp.]